MASSLSTDERALILAPTGVATQTSAILASVGIECLCAPDAATMGARLGEGAGVAIIDTRTLHRGPCAGLQDFIAQQPSWSDLPVLLLNDPAALGPPQPWLGNVVMLDTPFDGARMLPLIDVALRSRRRQYQTRDALQDLQRRLHTAGSEPNATERALRQTQKMDAIGQLAAGVAHDFNNLLTSIGGSFELIDRRLRQGRAEGLDSVLHRGQEAVGRAARLTHRLLAFSSRQSLAKQRVDLRPLLDVQRLQAQLSQHVQLTLQLTDDLWPVTADESQLREALDNLLQNACEAMPNGGVLRIEADNRQIALQRWDDTGLPQGDYLCLSIIDDGQGMSQVTLEHAFEPFFSTKPVGQGIGLGLSMVYGFSRQSQGHVALHSRIGHGTQVDLYLPRHLGEAASPPPRSAGPRQVKGRHVLLVEDDAHVRQLLCQTLNEAGFVCQSRCDASAALQVLRSSQAVDLLLSDVGLPGMNGRQLAEIARTVRPHLPVLFITGYAETAMAREAFLAPGMQLICKPFELKQLQEQVAHMLGAG
ncbi:response regulator [Pseudomonas putida]|uniref:histidine kinase n=1 Tax=Pseudomonas putida TaxID=303 RepID=A0A4D6XDI1_PSEPU|nr:response regulator [Pseudomonas putida]QCI12690.1 response regulator [Pseudomonas putida]